MNIDTINIIALAYLGDSIFDLYIRESLINKGIQKVELLQKVSTKYVSAKGQARILNNLIENDLLTEEELDVVKRGWNNKRSNHPKNTDIITYKLSTGFEALLGYLYLSNRQDRLKEILNYIEVK